MVKKILVIDDDDIFIFLVKNTILNFNSNVDFLSYVDGEMALEYFKLNISNEDELPEIILLDINMPYLDGWGFMNEFNKIISGMKKKVLVYIVSASSSKSDSDKAFNLNGVAACLLKPIDKRDLSNLIEAYPNSFSNPSVE